MSNGMQVGELFAVFSIDAAEAERGIDQTEMAMRGLERDTAQTAASIRSDMDAALRRFPTPKLTADSGELQIALAEARQQLRDLAAEKVGVSVSTEDARARLDELKGRIEEIVREHPNPDVSVQTAGARAQLDQLSARLHELAAEDEAARVHVEVEGAAAAAAELAEVHHQADQVGDSDGPRRAAAGLEDVRRKADEVGESDGPRKTSADVQGMLGPLGTVGAAFTGLPALIAAAVPAVAGLAAAVVAIAPAAAVAATGLAAVAAAGAAIKIGTSGVGDALKAAFTPPPGGASAAVNQAQQIADAQRNLKDTIQNTADANVKAARAVGDAQRNLADSVQASTDTQVQALRSVAMAERDLGDAQKNATRAQLDLTTARKQAKEDLEDLANQVIDAQDSQRESVLQLQQAKITLDETMRSPAASQAARAQAQLSYDEAVQHSKEQQLQLDRLRDKQALAARAGVDGSQTVIDAQDKLTQAQRDVGDRTQAVTDAQVQGHRQVALAVRKIGDEQRAVADAQQQQAKTAYQGTEQVQKAQEALAQAMRSAGAAAAATANALAKLAPNARAFVDEVIHLKGAWESLRFDVQQRLFDGLAGSLRTAAGSILPVLHTQLVQSAGAVNDMGRGVLETAGHMASSGVLGQALGSANRGLESLTRIPAQVIQGFLQIGAAAGPAFDRITGGVGRLADSISQRLNKAFSSGGMQQAINTAIGLLSQLGTVAGNLVGLVGEVLSTAQASGGGFVNTLVQISGALKVAFATPAVQEGLRSLFSLTSQIASTAAPLLLQALQVIAPVLSTLGPPLQVLVTTLGAALRPVIAALGPVLVTAAQAIGQLVIAAAPLLPVIGQLAAALLPSLTPLLAGAGQIFQQLAPLVAAVAGAIGQLLGPVLAVLPQLITPAVSLLTTLTGAILPPLTQLISQLPLGQLGQSFAQIAVALAPVLTQLAVLAGQYLQAMMPLLLPIITAFSRLAAIFSGELARVVQAVVVPALRMLADLLSGNLSGAVSNAGQLLSGLAQTVTQVFTQLPGEVLGVLGDLAGQLFTAGGRIIDGLINGIKGKIGDVKDAVGGLLQGARNLLPFSPAKEGPFSGSGWTLYSGQSISTALADGILSGRDRVRTATRSLVGTAHAGLGGGQFGGLAMAGAGGVPGGGFHIQNYYESETGSARSTAEELMWLGKGRG